MIRRTVLAALGCLMASTGLARAEGSPLRQALSGLPAIITENPEPVQALFLDPSALSRVAGQAEGWPPEALRRISAAADMPPIRAMQGGGIQAWNDAAGLSLQQVRSLASVGDIAVVWRLADAGAQARLLDHLRQRGFTQGPDGLLTDPGPISLMERMRDPWRVLRLGPSSVMADGDAVVQSASPEGVRRFAQVPAAGSAEAEPTVRAALEGVEARLGSGRIVQAVLFAPTLTLAQQDPAAVLRGGANAARERLRRDAETIGQGLPPYRRGLMVDIAGEQRPALLVSLTYPDCGTAETAAAKVRAFWDTPAFNGAVPAEISTEAVNGETGCAATILIETAPRGLANPAFEQVWNAIQQRQPTPLDIR
ncbi:hypothetical protein IBL26_14135 [Roseomonas aerophila]|uniref:Uncharacterized protein n=1 Tax=Teichococcus aerophilus TaxID=1224513 RepID=A0ABR7RMY9_9PROT|nr:hypothetical protein [Pseudoroseomonas aerophila]MBC9207980.1 hypothetical protein [Pseudoroseomonas aerophila]